MTKSVRSCFLGIRCHRACTHIALYVYLPSFVQGGDDLRLRRASVLREQSLLSSGPNSLAILTHSHGDGVGVYAVRHHLCAFVHARDSVLSSVVLLLASVSVLGMGGEGGIGRSAAAKENMTHV